MVLNIGFTNVGFCVIRGEPQDYGSVHIVQKKFNSRSQHNRLILTFLGLWRFSNVAFKVNRCNHFRESSNLTSLTSQSDTVTVYDSFNLLYDLNNRWTMKYNTIKIIKFGEAGSSLPFLPILFFRIESFIFNSLFIYSFYGLNFISWI